MSKASDVVAVIGDRLRPFRPRSTMSAVVALAAIVGALIPCGAGSADALRSIEETSRPAPESAPNTTRTVDIIARLVNESGTPLVGAVLVSSAGGQAVTNEDGYAELEVEVDQAAESVRVTGVATEHGKNLVGSMVVDLTGSDDGRIAAGAIMLASGTECEPAWVPTFGGMLGVDLPVYALAVFDDGSGTGPALHVAGFFTSAGGVSANRVAKWSGASWTPLGSGMNDLVRCLAVFDDGSGGGPALYAGGLFSIAGGAIANRIAKWDGAAWTPLADGLNGQVYALTVFDDGSGSGPALYAGGTFITSGVVSVNKIAKWDGTSWTSLGSGVNNWVHALTVFDDGSGGGPALYAGGRFTTAGGVSANRIAKWNGAAWVPLGSGTNDFVYALTVFNDGMGGGQALYAGGHFNIAGGVPANNVAKWDGTAWLPLGSGTSQAVNVLAVFDDGSGGGPSLYAGEEHFTSGVALSHVVRWDAASGAWTELGDMTEGSVVALAVHDDGSGGGAALYAGGEFGSAAGTVVNRIAKWNGAAWAPLGSGTTQPVYALTVFDDDSGGGTALYAAGQFTSVGDVAANRIAKWDGESWTPLGSGMNDWIYTMTVFDRETDVGPGLYAGGWFTTAGGVSAKRIAKWNGRTWTPLGSGMNNEVLALTVFDDRSGGGPALYAGGRFSSAGGASANRIARWNGSTWTPLGSGMNDDVLALTVFDDRSGSGPALYAGGWFTAAGGVPANFIAKWNGEMWSAIGSGMNDQVAALTAFDDGSGSGAALYAGGWFTSAGGIPANFIAKWDGETWTPLGTGMNAPVYALFGFDDGSGSGPALFAGGEFTAAGGVTAKRIAKWDGADWMSLGGEFNDKVSALAVFDDPSEEGAGLYMGGRFTQSPTGDSYLARWQGCPTCLAGPNGDLNGDGCVNGTDLALVLGQWDPAGGVGYGYGTGDANCDGVVGGDDLAIVLGLWQPICP